VARVTDIVRNLTDRRRRPRPRGRAVTGKRPSRLLRIGRAFALIVIFLAVITIVVLLNAQRFVPLGIAAVSRATGRELQVRGPVSVNVLTWRPHLRAEQVTFANADWSRNHDMLEIGMFRISLSLRRLLHLHLAFPQIRIENAVAHLEQRADGTNNWTFAAARAAAPNDRSQVPPIHRLRLRNTHILYTNASKPESDADVFFDKATGRVARAVVFDSSGKYQKLPAKFAVRAGSIEELQDKSRPFPLDVTLRAGATSASIKGNIVGEGAGIDAHMKLSGDSLSNLYPLIGVVLPPSPEYTLEGRLVHDNKIWSFEKFEGRMGDSDLGGDVKVDVGPKPPKMTAEFRSKKLDFFDLGGLIGATPGSGKTASSEQKAETAARAQTDRVLPDTSVDIPRLYAMNIDARLVATQVITPKRLPIDKLDLRFKLDNGVLRATPARFDVAGGSVNMFLTLNPDRKPPAVETDVKATGLKIARVLGDTPFTEKTGGRLGGEIKLAMRGTSVHEMASTADGTAKLALADAQISHLLVELIGLDLMNSIGVAIKGDDPLPIRCAAFAATSRKGKVGTDLFVIDTPKATLVGDLKLDLSNEHLDLAIDPQPKDFSLVSLRQTLRVEGTLKKPHVYPDPLKLGPVPKFMQTLDILLTPVVGLLTPVDSGDKKGDNGCSAFLEEEKQSGQDPRTLARNEQPATQGSAAQQPPAQQPSKTTPARQAPKSRRTRHKTR